MHVCEFTFVPLKTINKMNKGLLSLGFVALLAMTSCDEGATSNQGETAISTENVEATTSVQFSEEAFNFGQITQGEKVAHSFEFTNTGDADLVIVSAKGSCGCTVPEWPKEPIAPGAVGKIDVVFNSDGKKGKQHKRVTIVANTTPATTTVALTGEVIAPEAEEAAPAEEATTTEE